MMSTSFRRVLVAVMLSVCWGAAFADQEQSQPSDAGKPASGDTTSAPSSSAPPATRSAEGVPNSTTAPATAPATTRPDAAAPARSLPLPRDIIQRSIQSMGGQEAFNAIRSAHTLADVLSPAGQMSLEMSWMAPNRVLVKQTSPDSGGGSMGSDGAVTWVQGLRGYEVRPNEQAKQIQQQASMFLLVQRIESEHDELKTLDQVRFDDRECFKVYGKDREGIESVFYFDTEEYLIRGGESTMPSPIGEQTQIIHFGEWKQHDEARIRYFTRLDVEQANMKITLTITEMKFNALDESVFALPPEVSAMLKDREEAPSTAPAAATKPVEPAGG